MPKHKQTILITGAAKRVGAQLARHLSRHYDLVLHYARSKTEVERLAKELRAKGTHVTLMKADLTDTKSIGTFWKKLPACTGLIHNASIFKRDTLATMTASQLREHVAIHIEAPMLLAQGFMKQLPKGATGNIILLGDGIFGGTIGPEFFSYGLSKHALASIIDLLATAVAPRARANLLALGATLPGPGESQTSFDAFARATPLKRRSELADVAHAIDYLLAAKAVTGQVISLANGLNLATIKR